MVSVICAVASNGVIGKEKRLPWHLPADLKRFKALTMGRAVIMGRKTYESLGRPLPGRTNLVVTRQPGYRAEGCRVAGSLEQALALTQDNPEVFVIGGAMLYAQALPRADRIYLTEIHQAFDGDTRMPALDRSAWRETAREDHPANADTPFAYSFAILDRRNKLSQ